MQRRSPWKATLILILALSCGVLLIAAAWLQEDERAVEERRRQWLGIKNWTANFYETSTHERSWDAGNGLKIQAHVKTTMSGTFELHEIEEEEEEEERDDDVYYYSTSGGIYSKMWEGKGSGSYRQVVTTINTYSNGIVITEELTTIGSGSIGKADEYSTGASLEIDFYSGTYSAGSGTPDESRTYLRRSVAGLPTDPSALANLEEPFRSLLLPLGEQADEWATYSGPVDGNIPVSTPMVNNILAFPMMPDMDRPTEFKLPAQRGVLAGSYSGKNSTEAWQLAPAGSAKPLMLAKCREEWLPRKENATRIAVEGNGHYGEKVKIRFILYEVSKLPGYCMNSEDESDEDPDLDFYHPNNSEAKFSSIDTTDDGFVIETADEVSNAVVTVACNDFGAYGKLRAEVEFKGIWIPLFTEDTKPYITIPLDERGDVENHIADKYEKDQGMAEGVNPRLDKDSGGNEVPGDGLTVFDEYRGFEIGRGNEHVRTDPKELDLFVVPDTRRLEGYLNRMASGWTANIELHVLTEEQVKGHMWVNPNETEFTEVRQHGVWVVEKNLDGGTLGQLFGDIGSPGTSLYVAIDFPAHRDENRKLRVKTLLNTIAHEVTHACGVQHHGNPAWRYVNALLQPYNHARDGDDKYPVAKYGGACSGVVECFMSYGTGLYYEQADGSVAADADGEPKLFELTSHLKNWSFACNSKEGTGPNKDNQSGDASNGECLQQIKITDK